MLLDLARVADEVLTDVTLVAATHPNERLPKEEQLRCAMFAAVRPDLHVVCVERGYGSVDDGEREECDIWAASATGSELWLEAKRCWGAKGWVNKPGEQLATWTKDIAKLARTPIESERYFLLVGAFGFDPSAERDPPTGAHGEVLRCIRRFHRPHLLHVAPARAFSWRPNDGLTHIGAWVWGWMRGEGVRPEAADQPT